MQPTKVSESAIIANFEVAVERLYERLARMSEVLAWYANDDNYRGDSPDVLFDCGATARWVLQISLIRGDE